jgi:uncharacterized caspase-like protein
MAAALKSTGFEVTLRLELSQADMREAIRAYAASLIKARAVGVFYFAGHGVQLAWRNYLIPVDAQIADITQLRDRAIDVNSPIEGIRKAGNEMNIIILDACRDNPFGGTRGSSSGACHSSMRHRGRCWRMQQRRATPLWMAKGRTDCIQSTRCARFRCLRSRWRMSSSEYV